MVLSIWNRGRGLFVSNASISKVRLNLSTQLPSHCGALPQTTQFRRGQHQDLFGRRYEHLGMELWVRIVVSDLPFKSPESCFGAQHGVFFQ